MPTNADWNWRDRAACWDCPPGLFFPESTSDSAAIHSAKQICRSCDVLPQCLRFALDTRQEGGIWGGTDPNERARLLREEKA